MRERKLFIIALIMLLLMVLSACGSNPDDASESAGAAVDSSSDSVAPVDQDTASEDSTTATPTPSVSPEIAALSTPDPKSGVDLLLGSWIDIDSPERFANITKTDTGYPFEDNEGAYPATFADGQLKVMVSKVTEEDFVIVYFDEKLGNLVYVYEDALSKFKKK